MKEAPPGRLSAFGSVAHLHIGMIHAIHGALAHWHLQLVRRRDEELDLDLDLPELAAPAPAATAP